MSIHKLFVALVALLASTLAQAGPVYVNYSVTGTSGNFIYDFSVTNNLGGTNDIYFFGIQLPGTIFSSPSGFNPYAPNWTNSSNGGSNTIYNNNWVNSSLSGGSTIAPGQTVSGFDVASTNATVLTSVPWFAYAFGGTYNGGGNFYSTSNPGFESVALLAPVPEPSTYALILTGLGTIGFIAYRRKNNFSNIPMAA